MAWSPPRRTRLQTRPTKQLGVFMAEKVIKALGTRCVYCGVVPGQCVGNRPAVRRFVVEHLVPIRRGGFAVPDNLTMACSACNTSKRTRTAWEFGFVSVPTWANPTAPTVRLSDVLGLP